MTHSTDLTLQVADLSRTANEIASASALTATISALEDPAVLELTTLATQLSNAAERIRLIAVGVISARSSLHAGHSGLAQSRGHRNATSLIQHVTGSTRGEAARQVRVGESLFEATSSRQSTPHSTDSEAGKEGLPFLEGAADPWHTPLSTALMNSRLTSAQHDAIRRGLGEPPTSSEHSDPQSVDPPQSAPSTSTSGAAVSEAAFEAWKLAAERLVVEAQHLTVEELAKQSRAIRDLLDPDGAKARFLARYEARSFRMWTTQDGMTHGAFVFDDESAAWLRTVIDTALRPRRGGPRFTDSTQQDSARKLVEDPRTNEQLAHDLLLDVLRAGTLAEAESVLGVRQAGVRLVQVVDREAYERSIAVTGAHETVSDIWDSARFEDGGEPVPGETAAQQRCNSGVIPVIVDKSGNPLNMGREQRLYTSQQRIALAIRDGGCRWNSCDRPASYCEAHHIDEWSTDKGRTDVDRGILLCRFHHMQLHNGGWKITRDGVAEFLLHPPPGTGHEPRSQRQQQQQQRELQPPHSQDMAQPITLRAPLPLRYVWGLEPPPKRFRSAA